ncbi:MAG TPA: WD40 repeat domain-containing protein, partial [Pirellulaceae bacterium]|nr:WD40 repeat domain-containing protein [Pirellulaceae bacterium]
VGVAIGTGTDIAASTADGSVRVWGIDGAPADMVDISPAKATGVAFTADPKWLVVTGDDQRARIVRLSLQRAIVVGKEPLHAIAFTPDGNSLAVAGKNQPITLWNPQTGMQVRSFGAADTVTSLQITNDGQRLISAGGDKHVRVWQLADGTAVAAWPQAAEPRALRLNRDGSRLVVSGADGQARLVETATGRVLQRFAAEGGANVATPVPDGRMVVVAAADGQVRKHNVVVTGIVAVHPGGANAALFLPNGQAVASCGADKGARVSDMTGKTTVTFAGCDAVLAGLALRQDGAQLAAVGQDQHLYVWPTGNNQLERKVPLGAIGTSVAYSPDGTRIAATCGDGSYRVYQAADGRPLESASSRGGATSAVWLSATPAVGNVPGMPDRLLVGGDDGQAALVTPTLLRLFAGHAGAVNGVVFTPDGQTLLSGGVDKSVRLWNVANAQVVRALSGPTDAITGVTISGDGTRVAAVGLDKQVRVWNFADGAVVATLPAPTPVRRLVASPDGTRFATAGDEAVVRVF